MITVKFYTYEDQFIESFTSRNLNVHHALNAINTFDFEVDPGDMRAGTVDRLQRMRVKVEYRGSQYISGLVDSITISTEGTFRFQCNSLLYELTQIRAKSNALYQGQQVIAILLDLFTYAPGWRLGNITSMENIEVRTTIDLRGEERLFSQIVSLVNSIPNLYFREGRDRTIDFGLFNQNTYPFIPNDEVKSLVVETKYGELLRQIEAYGGQVMLDVSETEKIERTVTLADSLVFDASLAQHPSFPILLDKGVYVVRNIRDTSVSGAGDRVVFYSQIKPDRNNPTSTELGQAGAALWLRAVKDLEDAAQFEERWDCTTTYLPEDFKLGNRVFIHSNFTRAYHDYVSGTVGLVNMGITSDWFRVMEYNETLTDTSVRYTLSLSKNLKIVRRNSILDLYEASHTQNDPELTQNPLALNQYQLVSKTIPVGLEADCYNIDDTSEEYFEGRSLSIPLTDIPPGATGVTIYGQPFSNNDGVFVRLLTPPTLSQPAEVCVSYLRGWNASYTFPVHMLVEYT